MSTTNITPDNPENRDSTRPDPGNPAGVWSKTPYLPTASVYILIAAVLGNIVDVILAKGALDVVLNESEFISLITAIGMALIAVVTAIGGGLALRHGNRPLAAAAFTAWFCIGLALATMRWNKDTLDGLPDNASSDKVLALLMLAVFVAAGIEVAIHGARIFTADNFFATRTARRTVRRIDKRRNTIAAQYARVGLELADHPEKRARAGRQHDMAQANIGHVQRELLAFARDRIAEALHDPSKTGVVRQPVVPYTPDEGDAASFKPPNAPGTQAKPMHY